MYKTYRKAELADQSTYPVFSESFLCFDRYMTHPIKKNLKRHYGIPKADHIHVSVPIHGGYEPIKPASTPLNSDRSARHLMHKSLHCMVSAGSDAENLHETLQCDLSRRSAIRIIYQMRSRIKDELSIIPTHRETMDPASRSPGTAISCGPARVTNFAPNFFIGALARVGSTQHSTRTSS